MLRLTMLILALSMILSLPSGLAYAQLNQGFTSVDELRQEAGVNIENTSVADIILSVNKVIVSLGVVLSVAAIVWGGITYVISAGDDQKLATAKKTILYAAIGLIVIGLAGVLVNVVVNLIAHK